MPCAAGGVGIVVVALVALIWPEVRRLGRLGGAVDKVTRGQDDVQHLVILSLAVSTEPCDSMQKFCIAERRLYGCNCASA